MFKPVNENKTHEPQVEHIWCGLTLSSEYWQRSIPSTRTRLMSFKGRMSHTLLKGFCIVCHTIVLVYVEGKTNRKLKTGRVWKLQLNRTTYSDYMSEQQLPKQNKAGNHFQPDSKHTCAARYEPASNLWV